MICDPTNEALSRLRDKVIAIFKEKFEYNISGTHSNRSQYYSERGNSYLSFVWGIRHVECAPVPDYQGEAAMLDAVTKWCDDELSHGNTICVWRKNPTITGGELIYLHWRCHTISVKNLMFCSTEPAVFFDYSKSKEAECGGCAG